MSNIRAIKHQHLLANWKQIIAAQQASGLAVRTYCTRQNINYNSFQYWLRKIREDLAAAASSASLPEDTPEPEFAVLASASCQVVAAAKVKPPTGLRLHYGPATLEIPSGISAETLLPTLKAMREAFPC